MNEVELRIAESLDESALAALTEILVAVVDQGASVGFLPPLGRDEARRYWLGVPRPDVVLLLASLGPDRVVGTAQLHLESRANGSHRAAVAKVLVHPDFQQRGIGRRLIARAEEIARARGRSLLLLDTRAGDPSNRLYGAMGWVEFGRVPRYARSAGGQLDECVFYYKELI